jgi:hypothetical protein
VSGSWIETDSPIETALLTWTEFGKETATASAIERESQKQSQTGIGIDSAIVTGSVNSKDFASAMEIATASRIATGYEKESWSPPETAFLSGSESRFGLRSEKSFDSQIGTG